MAFERRLEAAVVGPGRPGQLRVTLGCGSKQFVAEVTAELLPPALRLLNSKFVAVVAGRDFLKVEPAGRVWLTIQDRIRAVLDRDWDPIGVADIVDDEYDMYIGQLHSLITAGASKQDIADRLLSIEIDRMGLTGTPMNQLLRVAQRLQDLDLPEVDHQQPD